MDIKELRKEARKRGIATYRLQCLVPGKIIHWQVPAKLLASYIKNYDKLKRKDELNKLGGWHSTRL